ncbi:hypothetical protein H1R20_g16589, partial [Candolleomyces eurysporus]
MSPPPRVDPSSSPSVTPNQMARLAGHAAFWTFSAWIMGETTIPIPIATQIQDFLPDLLYAVQACQQAFENEVRLKDSFNAISNQAMELPPSKPGSFIVVDCKGTLLAWHIRDVISLRLQKIAQGATLKLNDRAPELLQNGSPGLPTTWYNKTPDGSTTANLPPGSIGIAPLCMEDQDAPAPSPDLLAKPDAVEEYLEAMLPIAYILSSI